MKNLIAHSIAAPCLLVALLALPAAVGADGAEGASNPADQGACAVQATLPGVDGILPAPLELGGMPNCTEIVGCPVACWFGTAQCSNSYCQSKCRTVCEDPEVSGYCDAPNSRCICGPLA